MPSIFVCVCVCVMRGVGCLQYTNFNGGAAIGNDGACNTLSYTHSMYVYVNMYESRFFNA